MRWIAATLLALTLAGAVPSARADDASRLKLARDIVGVSHLADKLKGLTPLLVWQVRQALLQKGDADPPQIDAALHRFQDSSSADIDRFVDDVAVVYANDFTEEDLANLLAFYRTPTGQNLLAKEAEIAVAIASASKRWAKDIGDRVAADVAKATSKDPMLDPQRWRKEYIAIPARAAILQRFIDPMDKPEWTALRTITLAKVISERCRGSSMNRSVLADYLGKTGLDGVSIGDLDLMKLIVMSEFNYFDYDRLRLVCAAADDLFGDEGRLVRKLVFPGNGVPWTSDRGYISVTPFTDFLHQRG